jgi:hypothetical protein
VAGTGHPQLDVHTNTLSLAVVFLPFFSLHLNVEIILEMIDVVNTICSHLMIKKSAEKREKRNRKTENRDKRSV